MADNYAAPVGVADNTVAVQQYEPLPIERSMIDMIADRDLRAKSASNPWRMDMQANLQRTFSEVVSVTEPRELGTYWQNVVGRRLFAKIDAQHEQLFPDPMGYSNVVVKASPVKGTTIAELQDRQSRARLGGLAATSKLRDIMHATKFHAFFKTLESNTETMGTSYAMTDYVEYRTYNKQKEDMLDLDEMMVEGVDFEQMMAEVSNPSTVTYCGTEIVNIDPRNLFPCSVQEDRGIEYLQWFTTYSTLTYADIWRRRVVKIKDKEYGRYYNWRCINPTAGQKQVNRIYYDDINFDGEAVQPQPIGITNGDGNVDYGYARTTHVGKIGLQDLIEYGCNYTSGDYKQLLRKFGNDPDEVGGARYWIVEIVYDSYASTCAGGVMMRLEPCEEDGGMTCPVVMNRATVKPGQFFGVSDYTFLGGDETLLNILSQMRTWQCMIASKPPALFDPSKFDAAYLKANGGVIRLMSGSLLPTRMGVMDNPGVKPLTFLTPGFEAIAASDSAISMFTNNIDQVTGQTGVTMGMTSENVTATNTAAAVNASQIRVRSGAVMCETNLLVPLLRKVLKRVQQNAKEDGLEYTVNSIDDAQVIGGANPLMGEIANATDEEKRTLVGLFPLTIDVDPSIFSEEFDIEVLVSSAAGGRAGYAQALESMMKRCIELQQIMPFQVDLIALNTELSTVQGVPNCTRFYMTPEGTDRAMELAAQNANAMSAAGGGSPLAKGVGKASAPAEAGGFDPAMAGQGAVTA